MRRHQHSNVLGVVLVAAAAWLSGCTYMESALQRPETAAAAAANAPETTAALPAVAASAPAAATAAAAPITREKASTDCWMKYEKSGLSLDQRLPLVEKCTADKLQAQAAR